MRSPRLLILSFLLICCGGASRFSSSSDELTVGQGQQMQGQQMQGQQMQGASLYGAPASESPTVHSYSGWFQGWEELPPATLSRGQLSVTLPGGRRLLGAALAGTLVPASQGGRGIWTVIRSVTQDPTFSDGSTSLYAIDVVNADGTTTPFCRPDASGVAAAIPVAAVFNQHGDRVESASQFIFGCTAGVVAKCYRWGYRPWLNNDPGFARLHWSCTRMARADYCGDGRTWTYDGTLINLWDRAPAPGPFNTHGSPPPQFLFEAGWSTQGAVCLSKQRWATLPPEFASACPGRLVAPGAATSVGTVCDTESQAVQLDSTTQLFNESQLNVR
jgi:hypothetical protein